MLCDIIKNCVNACVCVCVIQCTLLNRDGCFNGTETLNEKLIELSSSNRCLVEASNMDYENVFVSVFEFLK